MSCDPAKALAALAPAGSAVAEVFGSPEVAAKVLTDLAEIGRNTPVEPGQDRLIDAQVAALFSDIKRAGAKPPTHSKDGLPKRDARPGYAAVQRLLLAVKRGDPLEGAALHLLTSEQRQRQIRGVTVSMGRYRCGPCGRFASARGGHFCPASAHPDALGRFLSRRLRVGGTAFPADRLAALIEQAKAGDVEMLHPITGERVSVTLDGLPLALQGGFLPPEWEDEGLTAVVTPSGRIVRVFNPEGLQLAQAPASALEQAAQASGMAITPQDVGVSPMPGANSWSDDAEKIMAAAVRNAVAGEAALPELRRIAEACAVLSTHGEYAGVGVVAAAEAVRYRSLDELRRIAGDPSVGALSERAQALLAVLDQDLPPLFFRAERGEALSGEEERRLYAYAGIQDRAELLSLAEESRRLWAERTTIVGAYMEVDTLPFQDGKGWYYPTATGGRSAKLTSQKAARDAAELYYDGLLSANGQAHQALVQRIERLPVRWINEAGGTHQLRCVTCGEFADAEHVCPNGGGAGATSAPATSAPPTFISTNIPTIAAYALSGQGFERHRAEQIGQARDLADEWTRLYEEAKAKQFNWDFARTRRREEIRRAFDSINKASLSRGRELLGQRAAILETFPTADLPSLTPDEAFAAAWLAQPRTYLLDDGSVVAPYKLPLEVLAKSSRVGLVDAVRSIQRDDPSFRYMVHRHFSDMPPERAAAIMVEEDEQEAYHEIRRQVSDIIRREKAARQGLRADEVWRDTAATIGDEEYRIVLEATIREEGWEALPKAAQEWLAADQTGRNQCPLCMQFTPKYGTHPCPVRKAAGSTDPEVLESARVALAGSLYLGSTLTPVLRPGVDPEIIRRMVGDAVVRFPETRVPRFGATSRQLRSQPVTLQITTDAGTPDQMEVIGEVCDGLVVHEMNGSWRISHVGSGSIVTSAPNRDAALVGMQELLTKTDIDWMHPEPGAALDRDDPSALRAGEIARKVRQNDYKGLRASYPLPTDPQPLAFSTGMGLAEGSEFAVGARRFKTTKVRGNHAIAYDHESTSFVVVNSATGAVISQENSRPIRTPAAADRVLAAQQKGA